VRSEPVFESERVYRSFLPVVGEGQFGTGWSNDFLGYATGKNYAARRIHVRDGYRRLEVRDGGGWWLLLGVVFFFLVGLIVDLGKEFCGDAGTALQGAYLSMIEGSAERVFARRWRRGSQRIVRGVGTAFSREMHGYRRAVAESLA